MKRETPWEGKLKVQLLSRVERRGDAGMKARYMVNKHPHGREGEVRERVRKPKILGEGHPKVLRMKSEFKRKRERGKEKLHLTYDSTCLWSVSIYIKERRSGKGKYSSSLKC